MTGQKLYLSNERIHVGMCGIEKLFAHCVTMMDDAISSQFKEC